MVAKDSKIFDSDNPTQVSLVFFFNLCQYWNFKKCLLD